MQEISENIIEKKVEEEFHVCEACGYRRGFHVSFFRKGPVLEVVLICPSCGQRYRPGWTFNPD